MLARLSKDFGPVTQLKCELLPIHWLRTRSPSRRDHRIVDPGAVRARGGMKGVASSTAELLKGRQVAASSRGGAKEEPLTSARPRKPFNKIFHRGLGVIAISLLAVVLAACEQKAPRAAAPPPVTV